MQTLGYTDVLAVLPCDHRASFSEGIFGVTGEPDDATKHLITDYKLMIYEAVVRAVDEGALPRAHASILIDDIYGKGVLVDAHSKGVTTMQTIERSGMEYFMPEYEDTLSRFADTRPTFAKALVRFHPHGDAKGRLVSLAGLAALSSQVRATGVKFLVEPLVPATEEDLAHCEGDKLRYDRELRPSRTVEMIQMMQQAGVEVDVWKIEGFDSRTAYEQVVRQARMGDGRSHVGVIILGRNETMEHVRAWIEAGRGVDGVCGFAVGRTLFFEMLCAFRDGRATREEVITSIKDGYISLYRTFMNIQ